MADEKQAVEAATEEVVPTTETTTEAIETVEAQPEQELTATPQ